MAKNSSGRIWPYILGGSITLVFGFCIATVMVTSKADIQESDMYMMKYQEADAKANEILEAKMRFDARYNLEYKIIGQGSEHPRVEFVLRDKNGRVVENAEVLVKVSRPGDSTLDQVVEKFKFENGRYIVEGFTFSKVGFWDVMAKIQVGDAYKFINIKVDTRSNNTYEFKNYG